MNTTKWENKSRDFYNLMEDLKKGKIKIPLFQRNYVWNYDEIIDLLNSINDGHPIGTFIFWSTPDKIDTKNKIVEELSKNNYQGDIDYIIDGQQRFTTLVTLFHLKEEWIKKIKETEKDIKKFEKIVYDIKLKKFKKISKLKDFNEKENFYLWEIFNYEKTEWQELSKFIDSIFTKKKISIDEYRNEWYLISNIVEKFYKLSIGILSLSSEYKLDEVINLFEKINTKGKKLSVFEIVNAKWYNYGIYLDKEFSELENQTNYEKDVLLDSLFFVIDEEPKLASKDKINFNIDSDKIDEKNEILQKFKKSIYKTNEFLYKLSFNNRTIPSENIFKWLSYLFFKNDNRDFSGDDNKLIRKYIASLCLNNAYGSSTNNELKNNIKFCKNLLNKNRTEIDKNFDSFSTKDFNEDCFLEIKSETNMMAKLMISCLIDNKDFFTNEKIDKDNFDLHHIYPKKGYTKGYDDVIEIINSYANITPINTKTNKKILNKKFSIYVDEIEQNNSTIKDNLQEHYVDYEIWKNDDTTKNIEISLKDRNKKLIEVIKNKFNI